MNPLVEEAKHAALEVLRHNVSGPYEGFPRTAAWGYPEPYPRDLLISSLGIFGSGNQELLVSLRRVLETLARNQSPHGQIPSLVHDPEDRGASDTTPLFLMVLGMFRRFTTDWTFLKNAAMEALRGMDYPTTEDRELVGQQPTSDWRDEQWVLGHGLYVNSLVHGYQKLLGLEERAEALRIAGCYHNGGVWPFVSGFYVAALVAAGLQRLAEEKLLALTEVVLQSRMVPRAPHPCPRPWIQRMAPFPGWQTRRGSLANLILIHVSLRRRLRGECRGLVLRNQSDRFCFHISRRG